MYRLRTASVDDVPRLTELISRSAHGLSLGDYTKEQVDTALRGVFGIDSQLIEDGTYFVVEDEGAIVGCGGWSYRATLFGNDDIAGRDSRELDPATEAAKIRAFFVDPGHARQGIGAMILKHSENEAATHGFRRLELGATLPGLRLYAAYGYVADTPVDHIMENGLPLRVVPMRKMLV